MNSPSPSEPGPFPSEVDGGEPVPGAELALGQWAVLGLLVEQPRHGFALASEIAADSPLGRAWKLPRPLVYRAIGVLERHGLVERAGTETTRAGPRRTLLRAKPAGAAAFGGWLERPVLHLRDLRSELLVKLYFHERLGSDAVPLLTAQQRLVGALVAAISAEAAAVGAGFEAVLADWRLSSARAAAEFLARQLERRSSPH